jgi:hypothetical protein
MSISYRKETNPDLLRAAAAAYAEAPPEHNTRRSGLARSLSRNARPSEVSSRRATDNTNIPT